MNKLPISVLLVENEIDILVQLSLLLSRHVTKVITATNGQEALEAYHNSPPDMIISDIDMPIMNGIELLKRVREKDENIPFILSSGLKSLDILTKAIEYKITAFLPKPIDIKNLIRQLKAIAEKKQFSERNHILEQYKQAVDISALVSKTDTEGIITYVNDMFVNLSGYTREELIGHPHNIIRDPSMPSEVFKEMWKTIKNKQIWQGIIHNRAKDGSHYSVKSTISPIVNKYGEIIEFISIREDITEMKRAKEEAENAAKMKGEFLANMSHEIRTPMNGILGFTSLLNQTTLTEKQRRYLDVVTGSTESLMSIINDILDFSKLESGKFELDITPIIPFVEFEKMAMLFSAKMDEKQIIYERLIDPTIPECIEADLLRLRKILSNLIGNALKFTPEGGNVTFYIKLLRKNGNKVDLRFGIMDTGIGIPKEKQAIIFEPFSQADGSTTRQFGGTGLGLSICTHLVSLMGGTLGVNSEAGKGSEFYFDLTFAVCKGEHTLASYFDPLKIVIITEKSRRPCQQKVFDYLQQLTIPFRTIESEEMEIIDPETLYILFCEGQAQWLPRIVESNTPVIVACSNSLYPCVERENVIWISDLSRNLSSLYNALLRISSFSIKKSCPIVEYRRDEFKGNVLVVEDNAVTQMLIKELLGQFKIQLDLVNNGAEALEQLKKESYNLILMDINMPVMGGIEAVQVIKARGILAPVIALTANAMEGDKERLLGYGFDGYLSKPIVLKELESTLLNYLSAVGRGTLNGNISRVNLDETILDMNVLRTNLMLSDSIIHRLLKLFVKTCDAPLQSMKEAVEEGEYSKLFDSAHLLRGSASNLRLNPISELAHQIEKSHSKRENTDYRTLLRKLTFMIEQVKKEIKVVVEG
ncbi:MAG: response regulator [Campylobacterales bacterium]|nr:response regulator [Campylobacterales bacterium]